MGEVKKRHIQQIKRGLKLAFSYGYIDEREVDKIIADIDDEITYERNKRR